MPTIAYHTLGCKVNQYETERMREALENAGFATVAFSSPADVCVINTCSVTDVADSKSRAAIRRSLRANPDAFVIVSGCYAELEPGQIAEIEGVDLVVPNEDKDSIPERIVARFGGCGSLRPHPNPLPQEREPGPLPNPPPRGRETGNPQSAIRNPQFPRPRLRTRAVVKVQDGCDHFCSYCIIPYARSRRYSRPLREVTAELESLAEFGYREIVLAGIRLGSYEDGDNRLPQLITRAAGIDGIERVRLSSVEPWEVDDALLDAMQHPRVCRHLHIPLQSGDDGVLARMNRPYTATEFGALVDRVRGRVSEIGVTTDVIVGFPGEDDRAFENTCGVVRGVGFSRLHVFRYSPRKRTRACTMPGQVEPGRKKERAEMLTQLGTMGMRRFAEGFVGRMLEVLVETRGKGSKLPAGFADNYVEVTFPDGASLVSGEIVRARVTGVDQDGRAMGSAELGAKSAE